ncbi:MAG: hypothetical protein DHS20C12_09940 [Pseudohongiella sp.]|nr:MAG: hypothetical protein DHS20C12_09940 [Pseudohongiella sp.]
MNIEKLQRAEEIFLGRYPGGFAHPQMMAIGKKHKMDRMIDLCQEAFAKKNFRDPPEILESMIKIVSRSSMVSVFEKPKFRDFARGLEPKQKNELAAGLKEQLYGNQEKGFDKILNIMLSGKMAKWSLISICPVYFRPQDEVFVKPTTAKKAIAHFELENLHYRPQPSWHFYEEFRSVINTMKTKVDPSLSPNSAAFTGFLMMSMAAVEEEHF